jgi:ferredoxin
MTTNTLKRSSDRKVTNSVTASGNVRIRNTFGLPSGVQFSCPGATSICNGVCYAGALELQYPNVLASLMHNWQVLSNANYADMVSMISTMVSDFVAESTKWGAPLLFRVHYDGDMYSMAYAMAWREVMEDNPNVTFWLYTRSFQFVHLYETVDNLTVYLSVDTANANAALKCYRENPWVRLAALAQTFDEAKAILSDTFGVRSVRCPEVNGALPLVSDKGSACVRCGLCIYGRNNVTFSSSKK